MRSSARVTRSQNRLPSDRISPILSEKRQSVKRVNSTPRVLADLTNNRSKPGRQTKTGEKPRQPSVQENTMKASTPITRRSAKSGPVVSSPLKTRSRNTTEEPPHRRNTRAARVNNKRQSSSESPKPEKKRDSVAISVAPETESPVKLAKKGATSAKKNSAGKVVTKKSRTSNQPADAEESNILEGATGNSNNSKTQPENEEHVETLESSESGTDSTRKPAKKRAAKVKKNGAKEVAKKSRTSKQPANDAETSHSEKDPTPAKNTRKRNASSVSNMQNSSPQINSNSTPAKKLKIETKSPQNTSLRTPNTSCLNKSSASNGSSAKTRKSTPKSAKKVPVWKQNNQPWKDNNDGDVYDFIPDSNEPKKPKRKRAPRKPKSSDSYKPSRKVNVNTKIQHDLRPVVKHEPHKTTQFTEKPPQVPEVPSLPSELEHFTSSGKNGVPDRSEQSEIPFESLELPREDPIVEDLVQTSPITEASDSSEPRADNLECSKSSVEDKGSVVEPATIISEWDVEEPAEETLNNISFTRPKTPDVTSRSTQRSSLALENCFGFNTSLPESSATQSFVESTPVKPSQPVKKSDLSGVSPVRKVWRKPREPLSSLPPKPAPARLENIIHVVPTRQVPSQRKAKDKQTTLLDFIKATQSEKENSSDPEVENLPPPTPPSAFTQPARRSYSKGSLRAAKRRMFQDYDEENSEDEVEEEAPKKSKKKSEKTHENRKKTKKETEIDRWAKMMSSHFNDIENFHLSFD